MSSMTRFIPKIKNDLTPERLAFIALAVPGKGGAK